MGLDQARAALATGPLCDACLGRLQADKSHGLTNAERGKALRVTVTLADDEPYAPPDASDCWVCEGICTRFEALADRVVEALTDVAFETYLVGSRLPPIVEENEKLLRTEIGLPESAGEPINREINREVGRRVGGRIDAEVEHGRPDVQVVLDLHTDEVDVTVNSVSVYGRYRKLERGVPQTEWPCTDCHGTGRVSNSPCRTCDGTGYLYETSVEEEVGPPLCRALRGTDFTFHGAGREDVDARLLGTGRPFVLEVETPHRRQVDLEAVAAEINESPVVAVTDLRFASYEMIERVKELDASKTYRMAVEFDSSIDAATFETAMGDLDGKTIEQRTPTRVDHRRTDMVRKRTVYAIEGELADDGRTATVEVHGEGGLYVKELVSGDGGRTAPSLAGILGVAARVTALDVLAVEGEAESFERPEYFRAQKG